MTTLDDKADAFLSKLTELGDKLIDAVEPATRVAAEATMAAIYYSGVVSVATAAAIVVLVYALCRTAVWAYRFGTVNPDDNEGRTAVGVVVCGVSIAGSVVLSCIFVAIVSDPMTWTALFRPDAYLAAKILGL